MTQSIKEVKDLSPGDWIKATDGTYHEVVTVMLCRRLDIGLSLALIQARFNSTIAISTDKVEIFKENPNHNWIDKLIYKWF